MIPLIHQSRFHWMSRAIVWMMVAVLLVGCRREPLPPTVGSSAGQQSPALWAGNFRRQMDDAWHYTSAGREKGEM